MAQHQGVRAGLAVVLEDQLFILAAQGLLFLHRFADVGVDGVDPAGPVRGLPDREGVLDPDITPVAPPEPGGKLTVA